MTAIYGAKLYWDSQDPNNTGWWLRYYLSPGSEGGEHGCSVLGDQDDDLETIASNIATALTDESGVVKVYSGDQPYGEVVIAQGLASDWRTL